MAPCNWDLGEGVPECCDLSSFTDQIQQTAMALATHFMWAATGRRYGLCDVTVRPCQPKQRGSSYRTYPVMHSYGDNTGIAFPYIDSEGAWRNCGCGPMCCCDARAQIELLGPVAGITEVTVDGVVVPPTAYRVDVAQGIYLLVRTDGELWPRCQDFDANDGENTFSVQYQRGTPVPDGILFAAGIMTCEFGKSISGDNSCRLPNRITSLSRQGIDVELAPPDFDDIGFITGIAEVDQVIAADNPSRRQGRPQVYSPDLPTNGDRYTVVPVAS